MKLDREALFNTAFLRLLAVLLLISGCAGEKRDSKLFSLYAEESGLDFIPEDNYSRVFMGRLAQCHWDTMSRDRILVCGSVEKPGVQPFTPGLTIAAAIRRAGVPDNLSVDIYMAGLWRAKDGVLYGIKFDKDSHPHPRKHVLKGSDLVEAGDAIILVEKVCYF